MADYENDAVGPLAGYRVLDLTRLVAGNMLTHMLADFGAEVIKIERPETGDDLRRFGKPGIWWKELCRSKKSITVDLKSSEGKDIVYRLLETSDVLVESFVPGTLERMGFAPDDILKKFPDLIIARVSGWGQTGPYSDRPGFGTLVEGFSGLAAMWGEEGQPPQLPPTALADMIAGISGHGAVVSALLARERGKARGQIIDVSLIEPVFNVLGPWVSDFAASGKLPKRLGNRGEVAAPRNVYETKDGKYVAMSAAVQTMWERLAKAIGRGDLIDDPLFKTNKTRVQNNDALDSIIADFMASKPQSELLSFFAEKGVTVGPILNAEELLSHPYMEERGVFETYKDDEFGEIPLHTPFPRLSHTPGNVRAPAPRLGQHNKEVLQELGYKEKSDDCIP